MRRPWISWLLLIVAYLTYGQFLHDAAARPYVWILSTALAIALAGIATFFWMASRRVILLGFKSDLGYSIMVLVLASLAVVAVVEFHLFAYILVLVAATLLVRVDCLVSDLNELATFLLMVFCPSLGLAASWFLTPLLWPETGSASGISPWLGLG